MSALNHVVLMGKLVSPPDLQYAGGLPVCRLRILVPRRYKGKDGQWKEDSLFISVHVWRHLAEICSQMLRKGSELIVTGRLQMNEWTGKDGAKRSNYRILAEHLHFLKGEEKPEREEPAEEPVPVPAEPADAA